MSSGHETTDFVNLLNQKAKENEEVSTIWATVKTIDWNQKICICTGELDDLDYYDVLLGIGDVYKKPKKGSKALLGIINGNNAHTFLIHCDELEEVETTSGESKFIIKKNGFIVKQGNESLKTVFNDMIDELNKIIVIQGTTINVPAMNLIKERLNTILIE